jgi:hypothetical protein
MVTTPPISIKSTIISHCNSLNTNKSMTYDVGKPGHGFGQGKKWMCVKPVNGITTLPY